MNFDSIRKIKTKDLYFAELAVAYWKGTSIIYRPFNPKHIICVRKKFENFWTIPDYEDVFTKSNYFGREQLPKNGDIVIYKIVPLTWKQNKISREDLRKMLGYINEDYNNEF